MIIDEPVKIMLVKARVKKEKIQVYLNGNWVLAKMPEQEFSVYRDGKLSTWAEFPVAIVHTSEEEIEVSRRLAQCLNFYKLKEGENFMAKIIAINPDEEFSAVVELQEGLRGRAQITNSMFIDGTYTTVKLLEKSLTMDGLSKMEFV